MTNSRSKLLRGGGTRVANHGTGRSENPCDKPRLFVMGGADYGQALAQLRLFLALASHDRIHSFYTRMSEDLSSSHGKQQKALTWRQGLNSVLAEP